MFNELLIIPDVHGRTFWKEPCESWKDEIVFLGDYHDPYGKAIGEPSPEESLENLRELVKFVTSRKEGTIKCLLGNHDSSYYTGNFKCRYDYSHNEEVLNLIKQLNPKVVHELWWEVRGVYNKYLCTHAGITKNWLDAHELKDACQVTLDNLSILEEVPISRGGKSYYGSPIWNSLEDFENEEHLPEYYQIFGHTWGGRTEPIITDTYAMLDCGKAFVLDLATKEIKEWSSNA